MPGQIPESMSWLRFLPEEAFDEFVTELLVEVASERTPHGSPLQVLIAAWRSTAMVYVDPELRTVLTTSHTGDFGPVEPPVE